MKTILYPNSNIRPKGVKDKPTKPLLLSGVGMRRKSLVVVDVDVYLIAINVSPIMLEKAKTWDPLSPTTLSDVLLQEDKRYFLLVSLFHLRDYYLLICSSSVDVKVSATITFMREITQKQLLDAFNEAFKSCGAQAVQEFRDALSESLGPGNLKKGETMTFYWLPNDTLAMLKNESTVSFLQSPVIAHKLLDVYIHRNISVSPELVKSIETNIGRIDPTIV